MSNDITLRPAYLGGSVAPEGAFGEHVGQPARISIDDGFHVLNENGQAVIPPALTLDVIMLWENDTRVYRPRNADGTSTYDSSNPTPPTCFSDNRITPSAGASQPQSELCANCRHAVWDQVARGGGTRPACDNRYKVACMVAGAGGGLFLLSIAPASRKPYEAYLRFLKANHAAPGDVITKLGYADKMLTFAFSGWVDEPTAKFVGKTLLTDEAPMMVGAFDKPQQTNALPKPQAPIPYEQLPQSPTAPVIEFTVTKPTIPMAEGGMSYPPHGAQPGMTAAVPIPGPKRRGRRTNAEIAAAAAAQQAASSPPVFGQGQGPAYQEDYGRQLNPAELLAAQRRILNPTPAEIATQQTPKGNGGFGMESPTAPPVNIQEALNRAFGPK